MTWNKLTRTEQNESRRLHRALQAADVGTSVSQVAKHLDDAREWNDGTLTLASLCARTGWDAPKGEAESTPAPAETAGEPAPELGHLDRIRQRADRVKALRDELRAELAALRADITAADKDNTGRNEIARAAAPGLSRPKIFEHLGLVDLRTLTEEAIKAAEVPEEYTVTLHEQPAGQLNLTLEDEETDPYGQGEEDPDEYERRNRQSAAFMNRFNVLANVNHQLRQRGLLLHTGSPDPIDDIAEGKTGKIAKKP